MSRIERLKKDAQRLGLRVASYGPGDGVTRYRFAYDPTVRIDPRPLEADYHAVRDREKRGTWLGIGEAERALMMYEIGWNDGRREGYEQGVNDVLYSEEA